MQQQQPQNIEAFDLLLAQMGAAPIREEEIAPPKEKDTDGMCCCIV